MERLTEKNETGEAHYPECFSKCNGMGTSAKCNTYSLTSAVCELLAAYEDTRLTPEQIREIDRLYTEKCKELEELKEEIQQYRKIGTVAECQEAAEKQRAKKPLKGGNSNKLQGDIYICRNCSKVVRIDDCGCFYCPDCGQAIDWSVEE